MVSGIITLILLACFSAGIAWAYSDKRKQDFEQAARVPLDEEDAP